MGYDGFEMLIFSISFPTSYGLTDEGPISDAVSKHVEKEPRFGADKLPKLGGGAEERRYQLTVRNTATVYAAMIFSHCSCYEYKKPYDQMFGKYCC